jgi:hypothetical protein
VAFAFDRVYLGADFLMVDSHSHSASDALIGAVPITALLILLLRWLRRSLLAEIQIRTLSVAVQNS